MIFGIGLLRTGTSSLCKALEILDFNVKKEPRIINLEYDAYVGALGFRYFELDSMYNESLFIYTYRDKELWVNSILKTFDFDELDAPWRWFGIKPTKQSFLSLYISHQLGIFNYFKNRNDILYFDIDNPKWLSLCNFLEKGVLDIDFPHIHRRHV